MPSEATPLTRFHTEDRWRKEANDLLAPFRGLSIEVRCGRCGYILGRAWADDDPDRGALIHPIPAAYRVIPTHDPASPVHDPRAVYHGNTPGRSLRTNPNDPTFSVEVPHVPGDDSGRIQAGGPPTGYRWDCPCGASPAWNFVSKVRPFVDALKAGKRTMAIA